MATNVNVTSNYVGKEAGEIIGSIYKQANTIADNLITVIPTAESAIFMRKTAIGDGLSDYSCGWNPSGSLDLTEVEIAPKKLKVNLEICKEEFRQRWSAAQMGFSAWNNEIPADEKEALMLELTNSISAKMDNNIWNGVKTNSGEFDGLTVKFLADATVVKVDGVTPSVAVTAANVIAQLGEALDLVSDEILARPDFVFGISKKVQRAYVRALNATNANFQADALYFDGVKLSVINALKKSDMALYPSNNVAFVTGLEADSQEVRIKDMDETDLSGQIRIGMVMSGAVGYADGADIVFYNSAS